MNGIGKSKKFWMGGIAVLAMVFTGCLTDSKSDNNTGITITSQPVNASVAYLGRAVFKIAATGSGTLAYQWQSDKGAGFSNISGETRDSLVLDSVKAQSDSLKVRCIVTETTNSATSATATLHVTGLTTWPVGTTVTAAAQGSNVAGSAIDLDGPTVYTVSNAIAHATTIDLLFVFNDGSFQLMSPVEAHADIDITIADGYSSWNDIKMLKVAAKPANQELAGEIYNSAGTALVGKSTVAVGDMFIVYTSAQNWVLVTVTSITGTGASDGAAEITVSVGTI
jgi:hypothetical protein